LISVEKKNNNEREYKAVVIGASAGGMDAIKKILSNLPKKTSLPVIIVQHISSRSDSYWIKILNKECELKVKEADEKEIIANGVVYIAPPGYHLMIEKDFTFSLASDERVNYSRPSIDVLFETAADAYKETLIGIVLTGANADGAEGLRIIKEKGGLTIVQDPETSEVKAMPKAAIKVAKPLYILPLAKIPELLTSINNEP
jgi:two-component system, chemotaxis family, protein-glutamate methylesterase/glutaminase